MKILIHATEYKKLCLFFVGRKSNSVNYHKKIYCIRQNETDMSKRNLKADSSQRQDNDETHVLEYGVLHDQRTLDVLVMLYKYCVL